MAWIVGGWARKPRPYDVVQVTQSGEWVIQLAFGQTIPVYIQGGQVTGDITGELEGLAIQLADEEVGLRAAGAL